MDERRTQTYSNILNTFIFLLTWDSTWQRGSLASRSSARPWSKGSSRTILRVGMASSIGPLELMGPLRRPDFQQRRKVPRGGCTAWIAWFNQPRGLSCPSLLSRFTLYSNCGVYGYCYWQDSRPPSDAAVRCSFFTLAKQEHVVTPRCKKERRNIPCPLHRDANKSYLKPLSLKPASKTSLKPRYKLLYS